MEKQLKVPIYFHLRSDLAELMEKHLKLTGVSKTEYLTGLIKSNLKKSYEKM